MDNVGEWLFEKYQDIRSRNPRYSLRAFANKLEIPNSRLIQIVHRKRFVNEKLALQISKCLGLHEVEHENLLSLVRQEEVRRKKLKSFGPSVEVSSRLLQLDSFEFIADPIHYKILALIETYDFESDLKWIARRIESDTESVHEALERLHRLGLVRIKPTIELTDEKFTTTPTDIPNQALRDHQKSKIAESLEAIEEYPIHLRDHTSTTMAIDLDKLPEAKKVIKEFRHKMSHLLSSGNKTEVYNLCIQLFPASSRGKDN